MLPRGQFWRVRETLPAKNCSAATVLGPCARVVQNRNSLLLVICDCGEPSLLGTLDKGVRGCSCLNGSTLLECGITPALVSFLTPSGITHLKSAIQLRSTTSFGIPPNRQSCNPNVVLGQMCKLNFSLHQTDQLPASGDLFLPS